MAPKYNLNHVSTTHPFMTCIVKVNTQYASYSRRTVAKVLEKCHGVHSFRMDDNGVVEISGTANPSLLLKMLGRAGRSAELCWFQFGECSSNLFMATNDVTCSRDGRYLHASNLSRPNPPSPTNYGCYDHNHRYSSHRDFQFAYHDQIHNYHHHHPHIGHHQHYDHKPYHSGYGQGRDHAQYRSSSLQSWGGEDIGCCTVM